jgi:hypothetical protein
VATPNIFHLIDIAYLNPYVILLSDNPNEEPKGDSFKKFGQALAKQAIDRRSKQKSLPKRLREMGSKFIQENNKKAPEVPGLSRLTYKRSLCRTSEKSRQENYCILF